MCGKISGPFMILSARKLTSMQLQAVIARQVIAQRDLLPTEQVSSISISISRFISYSFFLFCTEREI